MNLTQNMYLKIALLKLLPYHSGAMCLLIEAGDGYLRQ